MPAHVKDYEVMKDTEITDEGLVNFSIFANCDPISYEEATSDEKWIQAMNEDIQSIQKNNTWELTTLPVEKKAYRCKMGL